MKLFAMTLVFLFSVLSYADDITPTEKMGKLLISTPDISGSASKQLTVLKAQFKMNNRSNYIQIGRENIIAAGSGCILLEGSGQINYSATLCGINIAEKKQPLLIWRPLN